MHDSSKPTSGNIFCAIQHGAARVAEVRATGVAELLALRGAGARIRTNTLQRLRQEHGCGIFVQGPRVLPIVYGAADGGHVGAEEFSFKLKTPWSDGTIHLVFSPMELIEKLAALVPPPRQNLVRYHGVLAPNAKLRSQVVPKKPDAKEIEKTRGKSKNRFLWAALLARTFRLEMEACIHCGGKMRIVAALNDPASIKKYLDKVGLPLSAPEIAPARPPPQTELAYY